MNGDTYELEHEDEHGNRWTTRHHRIPVASIAPVASADHVAHHVPIDLAKVKRMQERALTATFVTLTTAAATLAAAYLIWGPR